MSFTVTLPMPPTLSALTNNHSRRGRIKSSVYKTWQAGASAILRAEWRKQGLPTFEKHLSVRYEIGLNYKGDLANREKALTDLLVQTIPEFPDDRWIDKIEIERAPQIDGARVTVSPAMLIHNRGDPSGNERVEMAARKRYYMSRKSALSVLGTIADKHFVELCDILGPSRRGQVVRARQDGYLQLYGLGVPMSHIGRLMNRDHSTVVVAVQKALAQ